MSISVKKSIYMLCFALLCIISQIHDSVDGGFTWFFTNSYGWIIAVIIIAQIGVKSLFGTLGKIWTVFSAIMFPFAVWYCRNNSLYIGRAMAYAVDIVIYGLIFIYIFTHLKEIDVKRNMRLFCFIPWVAMLVLMMVSKDEYVWPFFYLIIFSCFFLVPWTGTDILTLFNGAVNGIILGFFLIQGAALVFRPYDILRYSGMFSNPNMNALFYLTTFCGFLCKWYELKLKGTKVIWRIFTMLCTSALIAFTLFTQCRTAVVAEAVVILVFLIVIGNKEKNFILKSVGRAVAVSLFALAFFPVVYGVIRYVPAYFHHPLWFYGEYSGYRVHSWDPIDSEKYVSFEEALDSSLGRVLWFIDFSKEVSENLPSLSLKAYADELGEPALTGEDANDPVKIRTEIWKEYLSRLKWNGNKQEEAGFQLTETYYAPHAHNVFIQVAFEHGIPVGIMFIIFVGAVIFESICMLIKDKERFTSTCVLLFTLAFITFGFFEVNWRAESFPFMLLFISSVILMKRFTKKDLI